MVLGMVTTVLAVVPAMVLSPSFFFSLAFDFPWVVRVLGLIGRTLNASMHTVRARACPVFGQTHDVHSHTHNRSYSHF